VEGTRAKGREHIPGLGAFHLGDDCRPEFLKQIRSELAGETQRRSRQSAPDGTLAVDTPAVGGKLFPTLPVYRA
jgi:hypothetical protein